jgi:ABC-type branched-subunit amino acid transport system substrate-binding protein
METSAALEDQTRICRLNTNEKEDQMRLKKPNFAHFVAAFMLALLIEGQAQAQTMPPRIRFGLLTAITGGAASSGAAASAAVKLAVKEMNDAGGLAGHPVDLVVADTASDPTQAVTEVKRLIEREQIVLLAGPEIGTFAMAVAPAVSQAKIVSFVVTGAGTITPQTYPYGFGAFYPVSSFVRSMVDYAADVLKVKSVAVLTDTGAQGVSTQDIFKDYIPKRGMSMTGLQSADMRSTDYTAQLLSLRKGNPDVIIQVSSLGDDIGVVQRNLQEIGWSVPVINQTAAYDVKSTMRGGGPDVFKSGRVHSQTLKYTTFCPGDPVGTSAYAMFLTGIKASSGSAFPNLNLGSAVLWYDGMQAIRAAVEATKTVDGPTLAKWIESNSGTVKSAGAQLSASPSSHFLYSSDVFAYTTRPDQPREDGLSPRNGCAK